MAEDQYFWGRYKDWGNVTIIHVLGLLFIFIALVMLYGWIRQYCFRKRTELCQELMHGRIRLNDSDLSKKQQNQLRQYFQQQKSFIDQLVPEDARDGDPGHGDTQTHYQTHYNTSIAKSYFALEEAVRSSRPDLRHRQFRTIREFVEAVAQEFPNLQDHCQKYIFFYELARFGDYKCTKAEFEEFVTVLGEMVHALQDSDYH